MIAHVVIRRICDRDHFWVVKDFYDNTVETGHATTGDKAKKDARAAKKHYIARIKAMEASPRKGKKTDGGKVSYNLRWNGANPAWKDKRVSSIAKREGHLRSKLNRQEQREGVEK